MIDWSFRDEIEAGEINVPRAALQFARSIAYPDLNLAKYMALLHEHSEEAADIIAFNQPLIDQADQLSDFLFKSLSFQGNAQHYGDPRNSYLNEVLDRRLGIPISLTVIYIDIANRLGIPAYGIGLPGHFIAGVRDGKQEVLLDPFHGGRHLSLEDCAQLVNLATGYEGPMEVTWFSPASPKEILIRMLGNLRSSYVSQHLWRDSRTVIQLLRQIQPDNAEHLRDLGLVFYQEGLLPQATHFLESYLQKSPDAIDAEVIRDGMRGILDEWVPLN